ncbi:FAD-dependent thymidylate synthase [Candidatus Parvarchaeota archaeon]|nr:FAD-dependent thymidylate synthase [Candidatus Parvarchaeota archaeon]
MKKVQPEVYLIAETSLVREGLEKMLDNLGGKISKDWYDSTSKNSTSDGEYLIEVAGRMCYESYGVGLNPNVTKIRSTSKDYLENILAKGDGSILEHSTCTFAFLNVSRVFTHELVRHRAGTAISQESMRYVRPKEIKMWLPPEVENDKAFINILENIELSYRELESGYVWEGMDFDKKKKITSALRRILPNGMATNIIWTANHRTIRHVITMRTSEYAEVEIRKVFDEVAKKVKDRYPLLYQDFERKELPDGTGSWSPKFIKV